MISRLRALIGKKPEKGNDTRKSTVVTSFFLITFGFVTGINEIVGRLLPQGSIVQVVWTLMVLVVLFGLYGYWFYIVVVQTSGKDYKKLLSVLTGGFKLVHCHRRRE